MDRQFCLKKSYKFKENEKMNENTMNSLTLELAKLGHIGPAAVEAAIKEIYETIPPAMLASLPEAMEDAVLEYLPTYIQATGGGQKLPSEQKTGGKPKAKGGESYPVSEADKQAMKTQLQARMSDVIKTRANTKITAVLTDKPAPTELIPADSVMSIKDKTKALAALDKHVPNLVPDKENMDAYQALHDAVESGKTLKVYVNANARPAIKAVTLTTPENGSIVPKNLNKEQLDVFLAARVGGFIPAVSGEIGVKLRSTKVKAGTKDTAGYVRPVIGLTWVGTRKEQLNANNAICTSEIQMVGGQAEVHEIPCKSDASFQVFVGEPGADGVRKKKVVRASGNTSAFRVERKKEYVGILPKVNRKGASDEMQLDGDAQLEQLNRAVDALIGIKNSVSGGQFTTMSQDPAIMAMINEYTVATPANTTANVTL